MKDAIQKNAMLLAIYAIVATAIVGIISLLTQPRIERQEQAQLLNTLASIIEPSSHDNDLYQDCHLLNDQSFSEKLQTYYIAKMQDRPVAIAITTSAPDGYNGNICHYDFKAPHIVGGDDHADGEILRYSDVTVKRKNGLPSHMAFDKTNSWLYIVDGGNNRVIRMKTNSATDAGGLTAPSTAGEPLAKYRNMTGATVEVLVSTGLTAPCGIDIRGDKMIVSDNATGDILIYNVSSAPAALVGKISTGTIGIMGVRIDWDNKIWYVNRNERKVVRIDNPNVPTSLNDNIALPDFKVYPNPAHDILYVHFDNKFYASETSIKLYDIDGKIVGSTISRDKTISFNTSGFAPGVYTVEVVNSKTRELRKVIIQ